MMLTRARRRSRGQGLAEVMVAVSIMSSLAGGGGGAAWQVLGSAHRVDALNRMKQIYQGILMYTMDNDRLPTADFYPDIRRDPNAARTSPRSIVRQLSSYVPPAMFVTSRAPSQFQEAGLCFVWNSAVNGQNLDNLPAGTWLLMDMNAAAFMFPQQVPRTPGYLVLYADGGAKYVPSPPPVMTPAQAAQAGGGGAPGGDPAMAPGGEPGMDPGMGGQPAVPLPAAPVEPDVAVPDHPDAKREAAERKARAANPDKDDALDD